uniref:Uncharacterized protein n=1 Tax=Rhizophora mucronata TaxID=61149 RepID=A0A2P2MZ69_RHIMU
MMAAPAATAMRAKAIPFMHPLPWDTFPSIALQYLSASL